MKKFFTYSFVLVIAFTLLTGYANAQFPTIWSSLSSGTWATSTIWETFAGNITNTPGAQGTGTAQTTAVPSGTHHIYIRSGHTVTMDASKNMMGLTIEAGGSLLAAGNFTLKPGNGGTGFTGPNNVTITNNGTLGNSAGLIILEIPVAAGNVTITGSGTTDLARIRMRGGNVNNPVLVIDQDLILEQSANHALSAIYNPVATDNYVVTLNAGKKITISNPTGYFHSNSIGSGTGFGTYSYNINGTLDLTGSTSTTGNFTAISPTGGTVNLNINGVLKTGSGFNSSPVAPGVGNINISTGVTVDATLATIMNFNGNAFILNGTAAVKRSVPNDGTKIVYPITTTAGGYNAATISGTNGPAEVFTATLKNTFTNAAPANTILKEWNITEATPGGNEDTVRLAWTTADETASGFSHSGAISVIRWNGTGWDYKTASVTGTGTLVDPYVAKGTGFTSFGFFGVTSSNPVPVAFVNVRVAQKQNGIQVDFGNAVELDVINYVIERSNDGRTFTTAATLPARTNNGSLNSYTYTDANFVSGNNFYRIKATERSGRMVYSAVVKVNTNGIKQGITVYPNPVRGNNVSVQFENLDKAIYTVSLSNKLGQEVYSKQITHLGGSATLVIDLPSSANSGLYNLQISNGTFRAVKNIIIE